MLIWYANIPEETEYFLHRAHGGWFGVSLSLLFLKFIVPFIALLPRAAKRNHNHLIVIASLILVMQYVDVFWMVLPNFSEKFNFSAWDLGIFAFFLGLFLLSIHKFLAKNNLVLIKDPRIDEALHHHVTY